MCQATMTNMTLLAPGKVTNGLLSQHAPVLLASFIWPHLYKYMLEKCWWLWETSASLTRRREEAKPQHLIHPTDSLLLSGAASQSFRGVYQWNGWLFFQASCVYMGFSLGSGHFKSCYSWVLQQVKTAQLPISSRQKFRALIAVCKQPQYGEKEPVS